MGSGIMVSIGQSTERIEALRALIDRLDSPDLTLVESKALRCRLFALTGVDLDQEMPLGMGPRVASTPLPCEDRPDGPRSPGCLNCAA
jgi:hypothetical protein